MTKCKSIKLLCMFGFCVVCGSALQCLYRVKKVLKASFTILFSSGTFVMSDFIDSEAEESEEEYEEKDLKPRKTQRFLEEEGKYESFNLVDALLHPISFLTTVIS